MDFIFKDTLKMVGYVVAAYTIPISFFWFFVG